MKKKVILLLVLSIITTSISIVLMEVQGQIVPPIEPGMSDVVVFDISKGQETSYHSSFIADLQAEGFTVATFDLTDSIPDNVMKIIILGSAMGDVLTEAYTTAEGTMLANWVFGGGELMINGEHTYFVPDFEELMKPFGIVPQNNAVLDETDSDWSPGDVEYHKSWVYYQSDNFVSHPILAGVTEVQFFAGCTLDASSGVIITTDSDAQNKVGNFYYGIPNRPVAVALEWGSGRVVMFGDTSWLEDSLAQYNSVDNAKLAMQTIEWINEAVTPQHDVEAVAQYSAVTEVLPGDVVEIYVDVCNNFDFTETFDVTLYYDSVAIGTQRITLGPFECTTLTFLWDTTGVPTCIMYLISAHADSGAEITEIDEVNNWCEMDLPIHVIPELPLGTVMALVSTLAALALFRKRPSIKI